MFNQSLTIDGVYYADQQMHNVYINNILYIVGTLTYFDAAHNVL